MIPVPNPNPPSFLDYLAFHCQQKFIPYLHLIVEFSPQTPFVASHHKLNVEVFFFIGTFSEVMHPFFLPVTLKMTVQASVKPSEMIEERSHALIKLVFAVCMVICHKPYFDKILPPPRLGSFFSLSLAMLWSICNGDARHWLLGNSSAGISPGHMLQVERRVSHHGPNKHQLDGGSVEQWQWDNEFFPLWTH